MQLITDVALQREREELAAPYGAVRAHAEALAAPLSAEGQTVHGIGNFASQEATRFLSQCRATVGPGGGMLVGIDLKKDKPRLDAAYDDDAGITAVFCPQSLGENKS